MNQNDRYSLEALLNQTKEHYQIFSRRINWTSADAERLDDLLHVKGLQKDIGNRISIAASSAMTMFVPSFLVYKAWQRTKAVYSFNRELVDDIARTDDTSLHTALLEHLPYKDMLFFFSEGTLPKTNEEDTAGIFVHVERHPEQVWVEFCIYDRKLNQNSQIFPGVVCGLPITNGIKLSQVFDAPEYQDFNLIYKRTVMLDRQLSEQEAEELLLVEKKTINTAMLLLYYLSSENADIKAVKHHKNARKGRPNSKEEDVSAVDLHEVGNQYAEIVYRQWKETAGSSKDIEEKDDEELDARSVKSAKKRRPHVRRAHFQHYWIGKGRTTLVSRWKSDLFVGVNRDDQAVVVYDVKKESLKGKRNPNTSKKKRDK